VGGRPQPAIGVCHSQVAIDRAALAARRSRSRLLLPDDLRIEAAFRADWPPLSFERLPRSAERSLREHSAVMKRLKTRVLCSRQITIN
jgi:hypothetical protein